MKVKILQNALLEHSAILLTCIKRYLVLKNIFFLRFEWPLKTCFTGVISVPEYGWAMKMGQWPMSHSFTCKNQDFDGPFEILMGH